LCEAVAQVDWQLLGLGGHAYCVNVQQSSGAVAVGCGDRSVRLWRPSGCGGGGGSGGGGSSGGLPASDLIWQVRAKGLRGRFVLAMVIGCRHQLQCAVQTT
jgi:hypothetical protein